MSPAHTHLTLRGMAAIIDRMGSPVKCGWCGTVYDLQSVKVTGRFIDCSIWQSPCCNRTVDDRPLKGDMTRVTPEMLMAPTDIYGVRTITRIVTPDGDTY